MLENQGNLKGQLVDESTCLAGELGSGL